MRFAICNELFQDWDYWRVGDFVAATGYDGLEIAPYTLADSVDDISAARRNEIKTIAANAGIAITGLHWVLVKPSGLHICDPETGTRQRTVDYLRRLIDFCAAIGGTVMICGSPNQRRIVPEVSREQGWQWAVESLAACGDTAASRGVALCLKALPENLTNLLNTDPKIGRIL